MAQIGVAAADPVGPREGPGVAEDTAGLFQTRCAACHDSGDGRSKRAPQRPALARLNPARVAFAMTNGVMKEQADGLSIAQILELTAAIAGEKEAWRPSDTLYCADARIDTTPLIGRWAVDANSTAAVPAGISRIDRSNVTRLKLAWAFGLPDVANARSQPVVTSDTLFVAATSGFIVALDRVTGCIKWHQTFAAAPRTALTLGTSDGDTTLFFGDTEAYVNAVAAETGELRWRADATVSEHSLLTGAPVQHEDRLIVPVSLYEVGLATDPGYECCTSHGGVVALDAGSGERVWTAHMTEPATERGRTAVGTRSWGPAGVPVWSTPTIDGERGLVYVGTGQNASLPATKLSDAVVALDLTSGEAVWSFQAIAGDAYNMACDAKPPGPNCPKWPGPDHDIGASVVRVTDATGKDRLIVGQKSGDLYALDPDDEGRMLWQSKVGAGSPLGGVHWGLAVADGVIYAPIADPAYPWPGYRPAPGLYAVSVEDGEMLWESPVERACTTNLFEYFGRTALYPDCSFFYGLSAAAVAVNDLVFASALDGRVRAFAKANGRVLWTAETATPFDTVNGVVAHGGSIDVTAVQLAGDMLYVQSGYGKFGQLPGNVLLAFRLGPPVAAAVSGPTMTGNLPG